MSEPSERLIRLLEYIEQVEKLKRTASFKVPDEYFRQFQAKVQGLPGIEFNLVSGGDDVWMRVPRMKEDPPPESGDALRPWITLPKTPEKEPDLRTEVAVTKEGGVSNLLKLENFPGVRKIFEKYLAEQWTPWAAKEKPRRKTIALYNKLFGIQQTIESAGADAALEVVWGMGMSVWKKTGASGAVEYPLLTQGCEISLNTKNFDIEIRPRDFDPVLELDCYVDMGVEGVTRVQAYWNNYRDTAKSRPTPFEPETTEPIFKTAVGWLDPAGVFIPAPDAQPAGPAPAIARTTGPTPVKTASGAIVMNPIASTRGPRDTAPRPSSTPPPVAAPAVPPVASESGLPAPKDTLQVTGTWVLFVRKRTGHLFLQDIDRLKKTLKDEEEIPSALIAFVTEGADEVVDREEVHFRGLSSSREGADVQELYFPIPYNDEQVSIVEKLETCDGVVVQGPPGTGKTHTIANVICHFLAHGRRVLVTSKGEEALRVLQDKLPDEIRALSVSLLTDDHTGMKQFEHSVQSIATTVSDMQPARIEADIMTHETRLGELHQKIAALDHSIAELATRQLSQIKLEDREVLPETLARTVIDEEPQHGWLTDALDSKKHATPTFTSEDLAALREARRRVGSDLVYLQCDLPAFDSLVAPEAILALHKDMQRSKNIDKEVEDGSLLPLVDTTPGTFDKAKALFDVLKKGDALAARIKAHPYAWSEAIRTLYVRAAPTNADLQNQLLSQCSQIAKAEASRRSRLSHPVAAPPGAELDAEIVGAVDRLCAGKNAFALPFGHKEARAALAQVTVAGVLPEDETGWQRVKAELEHRVAARRLVASWNSIAQEFGVNTVDGVDGTAFRSLVVLTEHIQLVYELAVEVDRPGRHAVEEVFGNAAWTVLPRDADTARGAVLANLTKHLDKSRLAYAMSQVEDLRLKLDGKSGAVVDALNRFIAHKLGSLETTDGELVTHWRQLLADLRRLAGLRPDLVTIERVTSEIERSGAPIWAKTLRTEPASQETDNYLPATWLEAWRWRVAKNLIEGLEGHHELRFRFDRRRAAEGDLAKTYRALVAAKAWLAVYRNSPENVRQALQEYLNEIQAIGAGTGIRAVHHRQLARAAMERAYPAVPCWIMPQWRVSESIPPKIGSFDLVIIDEASQSDIWAVPALLRGNKLLVVGDHRQVSPAGVGMEEQKIRELFTRFLTDQPHASQMRPDRSIYDLARVVFAGKSVMLKEHFRCVPAIIEFSKREFYEHEIKPLRIPKRSERLDPPLIDVFVKGGYRKGDVNEPEARAILAEIKAIIADPATQGRSIGVCALLGHEQAKRIDELIRRNISMPEIVERRLRVGDPPSFQGRESDIMLLSMVLQKGDRGLADQTLFQQRMNVAASRARDRQILFRSIEASDVNPESLTARFIAHYKQPFHQDAQKVGALRDLCESDFEREMFDEIIAKGFRIRPQVKVGGYRIDFVVQGGEDRRLAVECDGDRYHGPGQWADDMTRQRVLERTGWTFWRCFASSFVLRRKGVLEDLFGTLERMGIDPLGSETVDTTTWVASRVIDPLAEPVEAQDEEDVRPVARGRR